MKKLFKVSLGSILAALPMMASAAVTGNEAPTTAADQTSTAILASSAPKYNTKDISEADRTRTVTAGYVKGAYNASIKAINKVAQVADSKQAILTSSNVTTTGTGGVVTGVTASNGAVAVTKANVTIPVGSTTASDQAGVYVD